MGLTMSDDSFRFTCACPTDGRTSGGNCATIVAAAASTSDDDGVSTLALSTVGAVAAFLFLVVGAALYQVRHRRLQPVDLAEIQYEILAGLNLGGSALSVKKDEMGISMLFREPPASSNEELTSIDFGEAVLSSLREQAGLPGRLVTMLRDSKTTVSVDLEKGTALLRMKRPIRYGLRVGTEERFAAALQKRATANKIHVQNKYFFDDVSVAVPQRMPQELDRRSVLRLGNLVRLFTADH